MPFTVNVPLLINDGVDAPLLIAKLRHVAVADTAIVGYWLSPSGITTSVVSSGTTPVLQFAPVFQSPSWPPVQVPGTVTPANRIPFEVLKK